MKRGIAPVAVVLAIGTITAGCGGDGSADGGRQEYVPEASTTVTVAKPPLTEGQFVARMNATCRAAWRTVRDNWVEHTSWQDEKMGRDARFDHAVRGSLLTGIDFHIFDEFVRLGAPPGEQEAVEAMIGRFQVAVELGWQEHWHAYSVAEVVRRFTAYNRRAARYGLDDCLVNQTHLRRLAPIES